MEEPYEKGLHSDSKSHFGGSQSLQNISYLGDHRGILLAILAVQSFSLRDDLVGDLLGQPGDRLVVIAGRKRASLVWSETTCGLNKPQRAL